MMKNDRPFILFSRCFMKSRVSTGSCTPGSVLKSTVPARYFAIDLHATIQEPFFPPPICTDISGAAGIRSPDDVAISASEFQYARNKSANSAAYLNTLTLYTKPIDDRNSN